MFTYNCGTPVQPTCGGTTGFGGGFAFILVLFILLAIICSMPLGGGTCCEEPRCF